jgi:hypothetical protein
VIIPAINTSGKTPTQSALFDRFVKTKIKRSSNEYIERKFAWELVNSLLWRQWLKPMFDKRAFSHDRKAIGCVDDAFSVAQDHAVMLYTQGLISKIERMAREFTQLNVDPNS